MEGTIRLKKTTDAAIARTIELWDSNTQQAPFLAAVPGGWAKLSGLRIERTQDGLRWTAEVVTGRLQAKRFAPGVKLASNNASDEAIARAIGNKLQHSLRLSAG